MRTHALLPGFALGLLSASLLVPAFSQEGEPMDIAAMMAKAKKYTEPGPAHRSLERFLGSWETETVLPGTGMDPEVGRATGRWLMEGRWIALEMEGTLMGSPIQSFQVLGYDNFKQSYVTSHVSTMDTAMTHSEGDMTPDGKSLLTYGTLDEYLTGEHDKMVKYAWRFENADRMVLEVHDLPIGEVGTKVVEVRMTRKD